MAVRCILRTGHSQNNCDQKNSHAQGMSLEWNGYEELKGYPYCEDEKVLLWIWLQMPIDDTGKYERVGLCWWCIKRH